MKKEQHLRNTTTKPLNQNRMKTAVEWLENQIKTSKYFYKVMEDIQSRSTVAQSNIFEQAKEMEKQQIVEAHGNKLKQSRDKGNYEYWFSGLDYFNKEFKKTDK